MKLQNLILITLLFTAIGCSREKSEHSNMVTISVGAIRHDAIDVSIVRLIATPQHYSGKIHLNLNLEIVMVYFSLLVQVLN